MLHFPYFPGISMQRVLYHDLLFLFFFTRYILQTCLLVEMLHSCHCMQFCALPGTQASSQLTGRGALLSLSGKGRVIAKTATTTEGDAALSDGQGLCSDNSWEGSPPSDWAQVYRAVRLYNKEVNDWLSLLLRSSPNADESFGRGCLQPMLIFFFWVDFFLSWFFLGGTKSKNLMAWSLDHT